MKALIASLLCAVALGTVGAPALANGGVITPFNLLGKAGPGLLPGSENQIPDVTCCGTGGEVGDGISFDSASMLLTINIGWGTVNGFENLTTNAFAGHVHGPTASIAPASFLENQTIHVADLNTLTGWNDGQSDGGFSGSILLSAAQVTQLFDGRFYINIHTGEFPAGEIRGNLVPVPEPASFAMLGLGLAVVAAIARRRRG